MDIIYPRRGRVQALESFTDRFSELPDHIIHYQIFSRLGANDIGRLRFVSTRFSELAISSPYLYFKVRSGLKKSRSYNHECGNNCSSFMNFLLNLIARRPIGFPLLTLGIDWDCNFYTSIRTIKSLLNYAEESCGPGVEELDIELNTITQLPLSRYLSTAGCRSLRISWFSHGRVTFLPTFPNVASLQVLVLHNCILSEVSQSHFNSWVENTTSLKHFTWSDSWSDLGWNQLKSSSLQTVRYYRSPEETIIISCTLLEKLEIEGSSFNTKSKWIIDCPFLKELTLKDCPCEDYGKIIVRGATYDHVLDLEVFGKRQTTPDQRNFPGIEVRAPNLQVFLWTVANCEVNSITNLKDQTSYKEIQELLWDPVRDVLKIT